MSHHHETEQNIEQLSSKSALAVTGVAGALAAGPFIALYFLAQVINPSSAKASGDTSASAIAERLRPVAQFELIPAIKGPQTGQQVFDALCTSCHTAGTNGAPKIGSGDWSSRITKGFDTLFEHAVVGFNQMPARGGNPKLSDLEVKRAITYMLNKSGGNFPEPADETASTTDASPDTTKK